MALVNAIDEHIADRHSTLTEYDRLIITLWIIHTYFYQDCPKIPYLHIAALTPDAGKTEIAHILNDLSFEPHIVDPTVASLSIFRNTGKHTAVIDEIQLLLTARSTDQDAFYRLVNHGNRPGVSWQVSKIGSPGEVDDRDTFFPKAFLGIDPGILREPLAQRSIRIIVSPGNADDQDIRERRQAIRPVAQTAGKLRQSLTALARMPELHAAIRARMANKSTRVLNDGTPLYNRTADIWRPLISIADTVGAETGKRIRAIVSERETSEPEYLPTLAEQIDSAFRRVMRDRKLTIVSWLDGSSKPLPSGNWPISNEDLGWPVPRGPVKGRLPKGTLVFNSGEMKSELFFKAAEFKEICDGIGFKPADVKQAYKLVNRLHAVKGRTSMMLPYYQGQKEISVVAIKVSQWFWTE